MDIFSVEFLTALLAIVMIDIVLAGDNAIVIALAARHLPRHLQRPAIVWGTVGAIVVRSAMTLVVVWLLKIPGLMLVGGAALVWIACRLLLPEEGDGAGGHVKPVAGFWAAMQTIVVADLIMGLDNVLAVAGAAQGSYVLVILGLLTSVPLVVWGSTLLLRWVERFPVIIYVGAGVLAWTAAKMITAEPFLKDYFAGPPAAAMLLYITFIGGVLWSGMAKNHRRLALRIEARLDELARAFEEQRKQFFGSDGSLKGETVMQKILAPVDGSRNTEHVLKHVAREYLKYPAMEIHLLNVQPPLSRTERWGLPAGVGVVIALMVAAAVD
jgi:YjbE family integral membrane protein